MEAGARELRRTDIVGREAEVAALDEFLRQEQSACGLVLTGGPGFGKTTLWEVGLALARKHRLRVLSARASDAEARFSFAALGDLLDDVGDKELQDLPAPQRHALEVALLRAEPDETPPEPRAIAVGLLTLLRALAAAAVLLVAIDDVQWLDASSAGALAFAVRRLRDDAVLFLFTKRPGRTGEVENALGADGLQRLELGPLSLGAMRRLLSDRLKLSLPRHLLRRLVDFTLGNPLYALEVGRMLKQQGVPGDGGEIPVPDTVEELLGTRVAGLPAQVGRLLLAVALSPDLRTSQLVQIAGEVAVDEAIDAAILVVDGDRVRASHPLLAAAARKHSRPSERRRLHRELARIVTEDEPRARHLALAADRPDAELAATLADAATAAFARGARQEAVELAEQALRLTPPEAAERVDRLLTVGGYLEVAGELQRLSELLAPELDALPPGPARVQACLLLSEGGAIRSHDESLRYLEQALAESGSEPEWRATVLAKLAGNTAGITVARIAEAESWALEALPVLRRARPEAERLALEALGWARGLRGRPIDDVCERYRSVSDAAGYIALSPERVAGQRHVWRGEIDSALAVFMPLLGAADERGEPVSYACMRLHLTELELRVGGWDRAARLLDAWAETPDSELLFWPMYERCRALLASGRGLSDEAERWASEAVAKAEAMSVGWDLLEALRASGVAALLAHEPERAAENFRRVWEHTQREGVDEPGVFPVAPELVEALVELGEHDEALAVTNRLQELAEQQEHPWGLATTKRCAGEFAEAAEDYEKLGLRFDRARTLRSLGRAERRAKRWGSARRALEQAAEAFEELGSPGWAEEVRAELERVGGRKPKQQQGELTPAERRVADLAAEGASNKEIAQALFVSVHTVEAHLTHAYEKLGIRSRTQLARALSAKD